MVAQQKLRLYRNSDVKRFLQAILGLVVSVSCSAQEPLQNSASPATTSEKANVQTGDESPEFVRLFKDGNKLMALQTAVVTYQNPKSGEGVSVTLIGAVHIAEAAYYSRLNQLFRNYDALLYEMVFDPEGGLPDPKERGVSPVSTIQVGLKEALGLTFQLDEVDYQAKNFVHADMNPTEFFESMEKRKEGIVQLLARSFGSGLAMQSSGKGGDVNLLAAMFATDRTKALRRAFAEQMEMMDGQMAAITGEDGKSTLITERNDKAMSVLKREIASGKKKIGIFYGAGHFKDMHQKLVNDFGLQPVKTEWMDAWELD